LPRKGRRAVLKWQLVVVMEIIVLMDPAAAAPKTQEVVAIRLNA
jgi:hypothetical protein